MSQAHFTFFKSRLSNAKKEKKEIVKNCLISCDNVEMGVYSTQLVTVLAMKHYACSLLFILNIFPSLQYQYFALGISEIYPQGQL